MDKGTYNHLGDHTQWSNARMTGVGLSIAGGVAAAITGVLISAAQARKQPGRVLSAQAAHDAEVGFLQADNALMMLLLEHQHAKTVEAEERAAAAEAALVHERMTNRR